MQLCLARLTSLPFSAVVVAAVIACSSEPSGDDNGSGSAGEAGGESTPTAGTGGQGEEPSSTGTGGDAGAADGSGGLSGGEAGGSAEAGGAGAAGGAGVGGAGGEVACAFTDGSCPTPCHEVPIVTGCGDEQQQATLCTAEPPANTTSCGVRLSDERVFYVDATYDSTEVVVPNPFSAAADFRACTQAEVDESDCRAHTDEPAEASARFVLQNTSTEDRWVLVEGDPCTPFDVKKDGASLVLESGSACADSACNAIAADSVETETWERVAADASVTLTWDGIELATYRTIDVCEPGETETGEEREQPGDGRCVEAERRAAAPGPYSITLGVRSTDPSLDDEAECEAERCEVPIDVVGVAPIYEACRTTGTGTLSVAFTLPEAGEAVVDVTLE